MRFRTISSLLAIAASVVVCVLSTLVAHAQSGPSLWWDQAAPPIVTGFAVTVDGIRQDFGLTPQGISGICGCRITLPFSSGRHTVVVAAYNSSGETAAAPFIIGPTARTTGPYVVSAGAILTVSAAGTSDSFFPIANYTWNWGDGTGNSSSNISTSSHTYAAAGTYTITLTVSDDFPASHSVTTTVAVSAAAQPPPGTPTSPNPGSNQQNIPVTSTLSWSATGAASYAVAFGNTTSPSIVATGLATPTYAPALAAGTTYFWRVTASNSSGSTVGPLWTFTTADAPDIADVVVYASDLPAAALHGAWAVVSDPLSPASKKLATSDIGFGATSAALAAPAHSVDVTFNAPGGVPFTLWLRMQALSNNKYNDSLWVQFSDAFVNGLQVYPLDSASALLVNLATDQTASSLNGWGWVNGAYWLYQPVSVSFAGSGSHTLRIQVREDGVQLDQVVLSPARYRDTSPGFVSNDSTIVSKPAAPAPPPPPPANGPYLGSPVSLPGVVQAENFDNGPDGVAYHDMTAGNSGGQYRSTDADIESTAGGGYNVGWMSAGDWMNYAVNVTATGPYTVTFRVASQNGGGSLQVGFNGPLGVWQPIAIPYTGAWQNWTTVSLRVNLAAGNQLMTLLVNSEGFNLESITVTAGW